jgi:hypothetical protein
MANSKKDKGKKEAKPAVLTSALVPVKKQASTGDDRGRPSAITEEVLAVLREAFLLGCDDVEACALAGISPATLYNHQKNNADFLEWKTALKQNPFLLARRTIVENLRRDPEFAMRYMERKKFKEFGPKAHLYVDPIDKDGLEDDDKDVISAAMAEHFKHGIKRAKQPQQADIVDVEA